MSKRRLVKAEVIEALDASGNQQCDVLTLLCPCRNQVRDLDVWHEVFRLAREGGSRARHRACHAISTLMQRAQGSTRWRQRANSPRGAMSKPGCVPTKVAHPSTLASRGSHAGLSIA